MHLKTFVSQSIDNCRIWFRRFVSFTIGGGKTATFAGGVQTLTVTTNAAGRAVAAALNPLSSGGFQIGGQTGTRTWTLTFSGALNGSEIPFRPIGKRIHLVSDHASVNHQRTRRFDPLR